MEVYRANIKIRNSKYYNDEIKKILDECAKKNNVSLEKYEKITELMAEKMRLNVKEKLNSRSDVEIIANQFKIFIAENRNLKYNSYFCFL